MNTGRSARRLLLLTFSFVAQPALADHLGRATDAGPTIGRVAGAFILCILLALAGALTLRARGGCRTIAWRRRTAPRRLGLVESVRINPQVQLCIVVCDGREMLLSTSPAGVTLLGDMPPPRDRRENLA